MYSVTFLFLWARSECLYTQSDKIKIDCVNTRGKKTLLLAPKSLCLLYPMTRLLNWVNSRYSLNEFPLLPWFLLFFINVNMLRCLLNTDAKSHWWVTWTAVLKTNLKKIWKKPVKPRMVRVYFFVMLQFNKFYQFFGAQNQFWNIPYYALAWFWW